MTPVPDDEREALSEALHGAISGAWAGGGTSRDAADGALRAVLSHLEQVGWRYEDESGRQDEPVYRIRKP